MRMIEKLKRIARSRSVAQRADSRRPPRRRRDPDWATLPGGSSPKEAGEVPLDRARELAD
jgi:hypothetical protein